MSTPAKLSIALSLSGGGIRAMVFHLGVLRFLAELGLLENVGRISTVSGGSLLVGLILQENDGTWPSSQNFLQSVFPGLKKKLCERSLQWGAVRQLLNPRNLKFILSRANLLALALEKEWSVYSKLSDIPTAPEWSINGTTAENGKRFRFKKKDIGDYQLGYAAPGNFPLASAMAISAAFPGGFGPLKINPTEFKWFKRRSWNAPVGSDEPIDIGYKALHLYDGGVYDNLGLEPFFDGGRGTAKQQGNVIIVSDAGAPLPSGFSFFALNPFRLKRVADIMADQSRALRVRTFSNYLQQGQGRGAFLYIGNKLDLKFPSKSAEFSLNFPTTLRKINLSEFNQLAEHGYCVANHIEKKYGLISTSSMLENETKTLDEN